MIGKVLYERLDTVQNVCYFWKKTKTFQVSLQDVCSQPVTYS